ncbi:MAG: glycosyltransferase family A protein [Gemmatimonadota bacterium]
MRTPTISVVIPCYNAAPYVAEAIRSVRRQRVAVHGVHEVILVDDGSTDGSVAAARAADADVIVVSQANAGISAARNAGVLAATGAWIAFLDADDLWTDGSLATRATLLAARDDLAGVAGAIEQFVSPDVPAAERASLRPPPAIMPGRLAGALLVRRELFDTVGLFSSQFEVGETLDWVARVETAQHRIGFVDDVVLRRRVHRNNSVQKSQRLTSDYLQVLRATIEARRASAHTPPAAAP